MQDRYQELAETVKQNIARADRAEKTRERRGTNARQLLVTYARQKLANYEKSCEEQAPVLQERYKTTIIPWWSAMLNSGLYEQLGNLEQRTGKGVPLNNQIEYYWPDGLYEEFEDTRGHKGRPFAFWAEDLRRKVTPRKTLDEVVKETTGGFWHSHWHANIYLTFERPRGIYVSQWPTGGGGCGFHAEKYKRVIPLGRAEISIGTLNPEVLLQFANQIESGLVTGKIESRLTRRKR